MQRRDADCPVCGSKLAGSRFTGFSCQKCKAHFSAKFVAHMRRQEFKGIINKHFVVKPPQEEKIEEDVFLVPSNEVQEALEAAHESAKRAVQHLDDIVGLSEEVPPAVEAVAVAVQEKIKPKFPRTARKPAKPAKPVKKQIRKTTKPVRKKKSRRR